MSANSLKSVNYRNTSTPQNEKAASGQKKNHAGGFSFTITDFERAKRFVILGAADGFYQTGATLAKENAKTIEKVIKDGKSRDLVDYITEVSLAGRAVKQQPGLFALAILSSFGTTEEKQYALSKLNAVARTGTTLFEFVGFALQFRSWGRALKSAVANWYTAKPVDKLAYQMVKYQNREGWSHGDLLKLTHAKREDAAFNNLAKWSLGRSVDELPEYVVAYEQAKTASKTELLDLIRDYNLTWEMVPNDKRDAAVWKALLPQMPLGALLRQLPTLTRKDVLKPLTDELALVVTRLSDASEVQKARLHPIQILLALKTYASGGRFSRGSNSWTPVRAVIDALNDAFYLAFKNVEPTGLRYLIGLDVSGSMSSPVAGAEGLSAAEATSAISLVLSKTEQKTHIVAFSSGSDTWSAPRSNTNRYSYRSNSGVKPFDISHKKSLEDVLHAARAINFGGTDCALPMLYAKEKGLEVDVFITMTDNETWAGNVHPHEALQQYRKASGINAKSIVLATSATRFSIANPADGGMLDLAGFDSAVPQLIREFALL